VTSLWITGTGEVAPAPGETPGPLRVPEGLPLKEGFPPAGVRWLDASSLWWANAARAALVGSVGGECGQVVGLGWSSLTPLRETMSAALRQGLATMPPALFPFTVGNAPAGQAGILLGLRGGAVTLNAKEAAGLAAPVEACRLLSAGLMERCVAGGVDALDPFLLRVLKHSRPAGSAPIGEGAWALALSAAPAAPEGALCRVAAWAQVGVPCAPHRYAPVPEVLLGRLDETLRGLAGWGAREADLLALPEETPALERACAAWASPSAGRRLSRAAVGLSGASWACAVAQCARALAAGPARRALLFAFATGGAAYGLALEAPRAQ